MSFDKYLIQEDYAEFEAVVEQLIESYERSGELNEGIIDSLTAKMKDGIDFIKRFAEIVGGKFIDFLKMFKNKVIFTFFSKIKWSFSKLSSLVKQGYKLNQKLHNIIADYIVKNDIVKWTNEKLTALDKFLDEHPMIKRAGTLIVVGFLIYQWTQMISFTGDIEFDFDQSILFDAITGSFSLADLFATPDGIKMLLFIATGALAGLSFPWPGDTWVLFAISIVYTIAKKKYPDVAKYIIKNVKKYKSITS